MIPVDVRAWVNNLDLEADMLVFDADEGDYRESTYEHSQELRKLARTLTEIADKVEEKVALAVDGTITLSGKQMRPSTTTRRRNWQNDDLLHAVLDAVLVNKATGEITDETPLQKVQAVYPLSGSTARITALKARGIQPDEFCDVEYGRRRLIPVR